MLIVQSYFQNKKKTLKDELDITPGEGSDKILDLSSLKQKQYNKRN